MINKARYFMITATYVAVLAVCFTGCNSAMRMDGENHQGLPKSIEVATLVEQVLGANAVAQNILVVLAHPDDETWLSGTLTHLAKSHRLSMVYVSSGDAGSDRSARNLAGKALAQEREKEVTAALKMLTVKVQPIFWRLPDMQLTNEADLISEKLLAAFNAVEPKVVISFGDDGITGHPDHIAVAKVTAQTFERWRQAKNNKSELWQVAFSKTRAEQATKVATAMQHPFRIAKPVDDTRINIQLDVSAYQQQRSDAFAQHKTQFPASMQRLWNAFLPVDGTEGFQRISF